MTGGCGEEMGLLIQADMDGALAVADAARLQVHLEGCEACVEVQRRMMELSRALRQVPRHGAPEVLRAAVGRAARPAGHWKGQAASCATGAALAACLALFIAPSGEDTLTRALVSAHVRALQPGHLIDVVSTDRHTVKPWFAGRLPFAPPVKDLAKSGFPLAGGRLDDVEGHLAAGLVYRAGPHLVDLFIWPQGTSGWPQRGERNGYNFVSWCTDGMRIWVVSDLNAEELDRFEQRWRAPE